MEQKNMLTNTTDQGTSTKQFQDQNIKTLVSQVATRTGARNAQLNFAVGFCSSPVKSDRLIVTEVGSALFAIGGASQTLEEELNLDAGERAIFSTDKDGVLKVVIRLKNDGAFEVANEKGAFEILENGSFIVNGGNLEVLP